MPSRRGTPHTHISPTGVVRLGLRPGPLLCFESLNDTRLLRPLQRMTSSYPLPTYGVRVRGLHNLLLCQLRSMPLLPRRILSEKGAFVQQTPARTCAAPVRYTFNNRLALEGNIAHQDKAGVCPDVYPSSPLARVVGENAVRHC